MTKPVVLLLASVLIVLSMIFASCSVTADGPDPLVSGTARDLEGVGMANVAIQAQRTDNGSIYRVYTGKNGVYSLGLPEGQYNISATIAGHGSNITYSMFQVAADIANLDFTIQVVTGRVEGHVTSGDNPVIGAQVVLSNGNFTYLGTTTPPLGSYSMPGVIPGVYVARAEMVGYWTNVSQLPVSVSGNQATDLDFKLEPQPARIFGKVTVNGGPEEGVGVSLMSGAVEVKRSVTDLNGNYSFSNIIAGEYQIIFSKEGLVQKTYPVSISPFENMELSVSMEPGQTPGGDGFIDGLDLTHSMMVVALIVVVLLMIFAIFVRFQVMKRPELLSKEEEEKEDASKQAKEK